MQNNIAVIGAGISGMAVASLLLQKGYKVTIYAKDFSPNITSNRAAAFWFPYHIRNDSRGIGWCRYTYDYFKTYSANPQTGISMKTLHKVVEQHVAEEQAGWVSFMPDGSYHMLAPHLLPKGVAQIYEATVPLIETQLFLPWLQQQLTNAGVQFIQQNISSLDSLLQQHSFVINCAALGAVQLCNDSSLIPVRGQVALLQPANLPLIYLNNEKSLYIVPRKDAIIVGGTYEENVNDPVTEPAALQQILNKAYTAMPQLTQQTVLGSWAGLRPYRSDVRVEKEPGKNIIHNYGHGGSGFTLSFGCALTVTEILQQYLPAKA
jgi:D-amino-acid oxidase